MRNISDTIMRLGAAKAMREASAGAHATPQKLTVLADFGSNPGALKARYHLPPAAQTKRPLVVMLHGCTQDASAYDLHSGWSRLADRAGFALLYPQQQRANNPNLCFNWFIPDDTNRNAGEALSIRQMIATMIERHGIDPERIFIAGLSAGGAMAASMLAAYPEVFAGGAVIAGLAHGTASTVPEAFDRMRGHQIPSAQQLQRRLRDASDHDGPWPRISVWQGTSDQTVASANAQAIVNQWAEAHRLDDLPSHHENSGNIQKRVWSDAAGAPVFEINMIAGMGHGTPIAPDLGRPGPYMLDMGVCSTRAIAGFWGIADAEACRPARQSMSATTNNDDRQNVEPEVDERPASEASADRTKVQKVIEDALRAAGLMR